MRMQRLLVIGVLVMALALAVGVYAAEKGEHLQARVGNDVTADLALQGIPMNMTPAQLPAQFRTQVRSDAGSSRGIAILKQVGNDIQYTFAWWDLTSPVISAHFHKAPEGHVGVRAYSICGVAGESPACPEGTRNSISGVWKNADVAAAQAGTITIAFHTQVYPAPIGELAVYIPAKQEGTAAGGR